MCPKAILQQPVGELPHIVKVRGRKAAHIRKCLAQIPRDTINDFSVPAMFFLRLADCVANAPIKQSHLRIRMQHDAQPCALYLVLYVTYQLGVRHTIACGWNRCREQGATLPLSEVESFLVVCHCQITRLSVSKTQHSLLPNFSQTLAPLLASGDYSPHLFKTT